jgi:hypothetical protein
MSKSKISYEEFLRDQDVMPAHDESIFYPAIKRRKLGITDEDMESIVDFFRWHINQRNRRLDRRRIISLLKLRAERLMNQKKSELVRELEALQNFSR